jgi:hypothetical protein
VRSFGAPHPSLALKVRSDGALKESLALHRGEKFCAALILSVIPAKAGIQ